VPKDFYRETDRRLEAADCIKTDGGKGGREKWLFPGSGRIVIVPRSKSRTQRMKF
jgi:hypothetical protein